MNKDEVPTWLVTLVTVFGSLTAISFGMFLYYHAEMGSLKEQLDLTEHRIKQEMQPRLQSLRDSLPVEKDRIAVRRAELALKRRSDEDEKRAITSQLLPVHQRSLVEIENELTRRQTTFVAQLTAAQRARRELVQVEEQALADERAAREERARLRDKIEQLSQELEALKRGHRDELLGLEKVVADRTDRVIELTDRQDTETDEMVSDGIILQAHVTTGFVVINRGLEQDLHEGTKFTVYNRRGGKNQVKGAIEVIRSEPRMAVARVLEEIDANDPIIPGDHIHNAIFNPAEQKIYVIEGDFVRFSYDELKRFIEQAGGRVDAEITKKTDYLVAGTGANFALSEASLNGVTILSENKLLEMVRAQERFTIQKGMNFTIAGDFNTVDSSIVRRWVKVNGGTISSSVTDATDVLIAGENAAEATSRARLVGATIINQNQLVHLMGTTEAE